jgi:hypothetical protein
MGVYQIFWSYAQTIFPAGFDSQGVFNKDPTVWLDGSRPPPNKFDYEFSKLIVSNPQVKQPFTVNQIYSMMLFIKIIGIFMGKYNRRKHGGE